jgi:hypothetical protein
VFALYEWSRKAPLFDSEEFDTSRGLFRKGCTMQALEQLPIVYAAIQYSILYMLLGGGFMGAVLIYIVAKALGK